MLTGSSEAGPRAHALEGAPGCRLGEGSNSWKILSDAIFQINKSLKKEILRKDMSKALLIDDAIPALAPPWCLVTIGCRFCDLPRRCCCDLRSVAHVQAGCVQRLLPFPAIFSLISVIFNVSSVIDVGPTSQVSHLPSILCQLSITSCDQLALPRPASP